MAWKGKTKNTVSVEVVRPPSYVQRDRRKEENELRNGGA